MNEEKLLKRKRRAIAEQNTELLLSTLLRLGQEYIDQERYEEAAVELQEEIGLCTSLGRNLDAANAYRLLGEMYMNIANYEESLRNLQQYLKIADVEKNMLELQRALFTIGRMYYFKSDSVEDDYQQKRALKEAKQSYLSSLKICDKMHNVPRNELMQIRGRLLLNIGLIFEAEGDSKVAIDHLEKAIAIHKREEFWDDLFRCYVSLAPIYEKQENSVFALKYYDLAIQIAERFPEKDALCEALECKADVCFSAANFQAAKLTLKRAYTTNIKNSDQKLRIERNLKVAHFLCESEEKLIKTPDNDLQTKKQLYELMGDACCVVKKFKQAIKYYLKMLECCEALGSCGKDLLPALFSLSQTYKDAGMYEESLTYAQKELDILGDNPQEACKKSLYIVELLEHNRADYNEIMKYIKTSYEYARIVNKESLEAKVLKLKMKIQEKYGNTEAASETRKKLEIIRADALTNFESSEEDDDDNDEEDSVIPDVIKDVSMTDILDESEIGDDEHLNLSRARKLRRQTQGFKITRNVKGETQLHVACIGGSYQKVKQLLDLKHPVNVTDNGGWTPLHEACNHGHEDIVHLLLDKGANINDPGGDGSEGITPLHDACSNGHLRIVEVLLDRGASVDVKTYDNKTPLDFLIEWAGRTDALTQQNAALYDSLKGRLKSSLEKAGVNTENVCSSKETSSHIETGGRGNKRTRNQAHFVDKTENSKKMLGSLVDCESSNSDNSEEEFSCVDDEVSNNLWEEEGNTNEIVKSPLFEEDSTLEYKNVMKALRTNVVQESTKKRNEEAKPRALIEDNKLVDDWLIDDLNESTRPNKKRKMRDDKGIGKLIGTLRKDVVICEDDSRPSVKSHLDEPVAIEETLLHLKDSVESSDDYPHLPDKRKKLPKQSSLHDAGFFSAPVNRIAPQQDILPQTVECEMYTLIIKVHIENIILAVPVPTNDSSDLTIGWLTKEAARRFLKLQGREPILDLVTKDEATLSADDPISVVYDNKEVKAHIIGWQKVSLMQSYIDMCSTCNSAPVSLIQRNLQNYELTRCIDLSDCSFYLDSLKPLILTLQYESSLKELKLMGNALMDDGIKVLASSKGFPSLEILDLSCNNIMSEGLSSLCNFLSYCQSLKVLNLSYNNFADAWFESIRNILTMLPSLASLDLRWCYMDGNKISTWEECDSKSNTWSLEVLDVSYNPLGGCGINSFLHHLNATGLKKLNVAGTCVSNSKCISEIVAFFQRGHPDNLMYLNISDCEVTDDELMDLLRCMKNAEHFTSLVLSNNPSLSSLSLRTLANLSKVPVDLDLRGCDSIFNLYEEDNCASVMDSFLEKVKSLSISCRSAKEGNSVEHWINKVTDKWKQMWGYQAKVMNGPKGLVKLDVKVEGE